MSPRLLQSFPLTPSVVETCRAPDVATPVPRRRAVESNPFNHAVDAPAQLHPKLSLEPSHGNSPGASTKAVTARPPVVGPPTMTRPNSASPAANPVMSRETIIEIKGLDFHYGPVHA